MGSGYTPSSPENEPRAVQVSGGFRIFVFAVPNDPERGLFFVVRALKLACLSVKSRHPCANRVIRRDSGGRNISG